MSNIVLLTRRQRLMTTALTWEWPGSELALIESPAEALAKLSLANTAVFLFDTRGYKRYKHVLRKFFSLKTDTDLVIIGMEPEPGLSGEIPQGISVQPLEPDVGFDEIEHAVLRLLQLRRVRQTSGIVGRSSAVSEMLSLIAHAAPLDVNILITGESGTGKELVARAVHDNSARKNGPFISLNCGALSEGILESELFGHAKGAFTGAVRTHAGVFQRADGGTLFLDEVAEMPLGMQTRFLRSLETGEFTPVGGHNTAHSDIRLLAATNSDLTAAVSQGRFRQDLYFRLRVVVINTPPLRDRKEDIPVLTGAFLAQENKEHGLHVRGLSRAAEQALLDHAWPGNVRELRNVIRSLVVLKQRGMVELTDLPTEIRFGSTSHSDAFLPVVASPGRDTMVDLNVLAATMLELRQEIREIKEILHAQVRGPASSWPLNQNGKVFNAESMVETFASPSGYGPLDEEQPGDLRTAERTLVDSALRATGGNRRQAANRLGISERTLYRKIKQYGLG